MNNSNEQISNAENQHFKGTTDDSPQMRVGICTNDLVNKLNEINIAYNNFLKKYDSLLLDLITPTCSRQTIIAELQFVFIAGWVANKNKYNESDKSK